MEGDFADTKSEGRIAEVRAAHLARQTLLVRVALASTEEAAC